MNWRKVEVQNSESQIKTLVGDVRSAANKSMEALWNAFMEVGDPDKLNAAPFIQQVMADVEQAAARVPQSDERFSLIETEDGYAVWDNIRDAIYVDDEDVQEHFASEWQAEDYLNQVRQVVADKNSAEWLAVERSKQEIPEPPILPTSPQEGAESAGADRDLIGKEVTLEGRRFLVEKIDEDGQASLRDLTFEGAVFPIERVEHISVIRRLMGPVEKTAGPEKGVESSADGHD